MYFFSLLWMENSTAYLAVQDFIQDTSIHQIDTQLTMCSMAGPVPYIGRSKTFRLVGFGE
jgi:hypothetical protein